MNPFAWLREIVIPRHTTPPPTFDGEVDDLIEESKAAVQESAMKRERLQAVLDAEIELLRRQRRRERY